MPDIVFFPPTFSKDNLSNKICHKKAKKVIPQPVFEPTTFFLLKTVHILNKTSNNELR